MISWQTCQMWPTCSGVELDVWCLLIVVVVSSLPQLGKSRHTAAAAAAAAAADVRPQSTESFLDDVI